MVTTQIPTQQRSRRIAPEVLDRLLAAEAVAFALGDWLNGSPNGKDRLVETYQAWHRQMVKVAGMPAPPEEAER